MRFIYTFILVFTVCRCGDDAQPQLSRCSIEMDPTEFSLSDGTAPDDSNFKISYTSDFSHECERLSEDYTGNVSIYFTASGEKSLVKLSELKLGSRSIVVENSRYALTQGAVTYEQKFLATNSLESADWLLPWAEADKKITVNFLAPTATILSEYPRRISLVIERIGLVGEKID